MKFPNVAVKPVFWEGVEVPDYQAIVDLNTQHTFCVSSTKYKLVRHEEALNGVLSLIEDYHYNIDTNLYENGGRLEAVITFDMDYEIGTGDIVKPTITIRNSYDLGWRFVMLFGAYRLVCSNGLFVGESFANYKKKHTGALDLRHMGHVLRHGLEDFKSQVDHWSAWTNHTARAEDVEYAMGVLNKTEWGLLLPKLDVSLHDEIVDDVVITKVDGVSMTQWYFYNAVTRFLTHDVDNVNRRITLTQKFMRIF